MSITKSKDKRTGITYVYESESYWDKELKAPRNRKKLIGKIDDATGEVVPTGKRGRRPKTGTAEPDSRDYQKLYESGEESLRQKEREILELNKELSRTKAELKYARQMLDKIRDILA